MKSVYVYPPKHMADATLSQANPVSTTLYTVLDTTKNVRIILIEAHITWATTQPTLMDVVVTVDGQSVVFRIANPINATPYEANWIAETALAALVVTTNNHYRNRTFLLEGRSVKIEVRITWATTQPTPLVCRVKYAKY